MAIVSDLLGTPASLRYASRRPRPPAVEPSCSCMTAGRVALTIHCMAAALFSVAALLAGATDIALLIGVGMTAAVGLSWSIGGTCDCTATGN